MKWIAAFLLIACAAFPWGCGNPVETSPEFSLESAAKLRYTRDARTGLCFAVVQFPGPYTTGAEITYVPCEPKVLELATK